MGPGPEPGEEGGAGRHENRHPGRGVRRQHHGDDGGQGCDGDGVAGLQSRPEQAAEGRGCGRVEAVVARVAEGIADEGAHQRHEVPQDEDSDPGGPEAQASSALLWLGDADGGGLVDGHVRSGETAQAAGVEETRDLQAVEPVAHPEQRRGRDGRRGATEPAGHQSHEGELRPAGEEECGQRLRLQHRQAGGHGERAEADAIGAGGQAHRQRLPQHLSPPGRREGRHSPGCSGSAIWATRRTSRAVWPSAETTRSR